jgi:exopolysaccharide biosynthesis polyprenyl glycosylphosphotransferase
MTTKDSRGNVSSPVFNSGRQQPLITDWAVRLIPGVSNAMGNGAKKKAHLRACDSLLSQVLGPSARINLEVGCRINSTAGPAERPHYESQQPRRNVLIVGAGAFGRRIASCIQRHPEQGRVVCGFLDDRRPLGDGVIGRTGNLGRLSRTSFVDEIILAAPDDREMTLQVLREARRLHLDVEMAVDLFGCEPAQSSVRRVGEFPFICMHREHLPAIRLLAKRAVDFVGAASGLLVLGPILALIAGLIRLDSPGPVLYSALRVGRKGRPFRCYKFRTMVRNADDLKSGLRGHNERSGPFFKIAGDPRITGVGRWLRRYSLDELPQLWNVLRGEMSLVGPRPHPLDDFAAYGVEHLARLDVTPGITGLWQVAARQHPSFEKGVELDREYIQAWSLFMDLQILCKTVLTVLRGDGV